MVVGLASRTRASATAARVTTLFTGVLVAVLVGNGVFDGVDVFVGVGEGPVVGDGVLGSVDVAVAVRVAVGVVEGVFVMVGVRLGVGVPGPETLISHTCPSFSVGLLSLSAPRSTTYIFLIA